MAPIVPPHKLGTLLDEPTEVGNLVPRVSITECLQRVFDKRESLKNLVKMRGEEWSWCLPSRAFPCPLNRLPQFSRDLLKLKQLLLTDGRIMEARIMVRMEEAVDIHRRRIPEELERIPEGYYGTPSPTSRGFHGYLSKIPSDA